MHGAHVVQQAIRMGNEGDGHDERWQNAVTDRYYAGRRTLSNRGRVTRDHRRPVLNLIPP
jgi:hypothetical protein